MKLSALTPAELRSVMVGTWHRLGSIFGNAFESQYGGINGAGLATWQSGLLTFTVGQLGAALRMCEDWDRQFPPTLPQFRALCFAARNAEQPSLTAQRIEQERQLTRQTHQGLTPIAQAELAKMKKIITGA